MLEVDREDDDAASLSRDKDRNSQASAKPAFSRLTAISSIQKLQKCDEDYNCSEVRGKQRTYQTLEEEDRDRSERKLKRELSELRRYRQDLEAYVDREAAHQCQKIDGGRAKLMELIRAQSPRDVERLK